MLPLAPRPFSQLAARCYRLRIPVPCGYAGALIVGSPAWYCQRRRRRRDRTVRHRILCALRFERARVRRSAPATRTKLPPMLYERCEVA
jgi:hypothetical protein